MDGSSDWFRTTPAHPLVRKFRNLGIDRDEDLQPLVQAIKVKRKVVRGRDVLRTGRCPAQSTVLLRGVACWYRTMANGRRQIYSFQYAGDFCDLHRYVLPDSDDAVAAQTDCVIGTVPHEDITQIIGRHPKLALALWRATILDAGIVRERLRNMQRPALARIANLLCEQMVRLEAVGGDALVIPIRQLDLADASGLSVVHMNRTIQDLRRLGVLSDQSRAIEILHKDRLMKIGQFDGGYLNGRELLSHSL
jgi:CRP-like cAMP-binding protein